MKKLLLLAIVGLAGGAASCYGAGGFIYLDNYSTYGPLITFGPGSGGPLGQGITSGFTVGLYYGEGAFAASVPADPIGVAIPTSLYSSLVLGTGPGSTAAAYTSAFDSPGQFQGFEYFQANSVTGATSTVMVVAYNGSSYASSIVRGHSVAFQMPTGAQTNPNAPKVGNYMSAFSVRAVPEPSILALAGFGLVSMLFARQRK